MKSYWFLLLFLLLLSTVAPNFPRASCEELYQAISCHDDHLNDASDAFPNDYLPFVIPLPISGNERITIAPIITCTCYDNGTWIPNYHPCKSAQTILVDNNWHDGNANYTYIFEDWIDYDWNDIVVNLYGSISYGIFSDLFLAFREAAWKNPFGLQISVEGMHIKIDWNSTDFPSTHSLFLADGETVEVNLLAESNPGDKAFVRFLLPPFASFSWQPALPFVGDIVEFDASASYDHDKEIAAYSWVFGDGTSANTDKKTITHSFLSSGNYSVRLTVIDTDGLTDTVSKSIRIRAAIGGKTSSLDGSLITAWEKVNISLIVALVVIATLIQRKRNNRIT